MREPTKEDRQAAWEYGYRCYMGRVAVAWEYGYRCYMGRVAPMDHEQKWIDTGAGVRRVAMDIVALAQLIADTRARERGVIASHLTRALTAQMDAVKAIVQKHVDREEEDHDPARHADCGSSHCRAEMIMDALDTGDLTGGAR